MPTHIHNVLKTFMEILDVMHHPITTDFMLHIGAVTQIDLEEYLEDTYKIILLTILNYLSK